MCRKESPAFMGLHPKESSLANPGAQGSVRGGICAVEKTKTGSPSQVAHLVGASILYPKSGKFDCPSGCTPRFQI